MNTPLNANRRRSRRQKTRKSSKITCHSGMLGYGSNLAIEILDLSETGIRLRVKLECPPGKELLFHFSSLSHAKPVPIPGKVIWCITTAENDFCIGVEFLKPLKYKDLQML